MRLLSIALLLSLLTGACIRAKKLKGPAHARVYEDYLDCLEAPPDTPSYWVNLAMCRPHWLQSHELPAIDLDAAPVTAAALVAICASTNQCNPSEPSAWTMLAFTWDLAMRLDPDAVDAALARTPVPDYMRADFSARQRAARAHVLATVEALGPHWRDVFLRPVTTARAARAAADAELAPWLPQIAEFVVAADRAVMAGTPEATLVDQALALRRNYVAACRKHRADLEECLGDRAALDVTGVITRLATARDDGPLLVAESVLRWVPDRSDPRTAEWLAVQRAIADERARFAEYTAARGQGVSAAALADRWPEPPLDIPEQAMDVGGEPRQREAGQWSANEVDEVVEAVRAIKRSGRKATVLFRKDVYRGVEPTGCRETNRVDSVDSYGHIIYRTVCTGPDRAYSDDRTIKPVTVPWAEVAKVKPGEVIHVQVDRKTRRGHVATVGAPRPKGDQYSRDTTRVQLREWRLPAAP